MSLVDDAIAAAHRAGIDPNIFVRQIQQESGFNPNAVSPAGAEGVAQFMPGTARGLGINPWDPVQALYAAAQYMANSLRTFGGDYAKALAAYNAGGGAVNYAIARGGSNWQRYLPSETQNYIRIILGGKGNPLPAAPPVNITKSPLPAGHPDGISEPLPHPISIPHTPFAQPQALSVQKQRAPFGQPYSPLLPQRQAPKPRTLFGIPFSLSLRRQPSVPVAKPKATRPQPAPKPAAQKKSTGKRRVGGPN